jgi:hypothetical protein
MTTPSTSPHFDLNSFLRLQQNYIANLNGQSQTGAITNLNTQLTNLYNNAQGSVLDANATLLNQNQVNNILETENQRLLAKKQNIDLATQGQERMIQLNQNYQLRYAVYTKMIMTIVLVLFLCILIGQMETYITIIPAAVYMLFYVIAITGGMIYLYILYTNLSRRNPMDYNEIMIPPPLNVGQNTGTPSNASGVNPNLTAELGSYYGCIGQNCCASGLSWSPLTGCSLTPAAVTSSNSSSTTTPS